MIREFIQGRVKSLSGGNSTTGEVGIGGFTLFARVSDAATYAAQVPTQVLEDGSIAADHIINEPLVLTISGDVSDTHIRLSPPMQVGIASDSAIGQAVALLPNRTQSQLNKIHSIGQSVLDAVDRADRLIKVGQDVFGAFNPQSPGKPIREQFVDFIESVYYGKQLITIDAAYRTHEDMAITSLTVNRNNQSDSLQFEIVVQKVDFVELIYTDIQQFYKAPSPAVKPSVAGKTDQGAQEVSAEKAGEAKTKSLASVLLGR